MTGKVEYSRGQDGTTTTSQPAVPDEHLNWDISGRATWRASARHKFAVGV